jgi:hypothetical protein
MGLQDEVAKLVGSESAKHKRLIEYVVRQVKTDRHLQDVLEDPYVTNRLSTLDRRALLEEPEIIDAVHEDVLTSMREKLEAAVGR